MKKYTNIKLLIIFAIIICGIFLGNKVNAASIGTVDSLDENNYPGFKEKIKMVQATYPNIKILYTGLDWNTVIYNETSAAHGRNLVSTDSSKEWICQHCKDNGVLYDSGLYCASDEAVRYVMDPRNYLTPRDIFQFQKLNTPVGTTEEEIQTVLQYQNVTYLQNDSDAIKAFTKVATNNSLNAYHLITRIIQEQGRSGTSTLSSGLGYTGNGYTNYGYGYYNLFSIGATRKSSDPVYKIYLNALDRAAIEGWTTRALSISGGGNFVGNQYIDVGQNTLYLQKFAVYNTNGQLYWHQYMQNLFAAQNEASILYKCYQATGIQNSTNFEFLIPVYENMPEVASPEPGVAYDGYMTSYEYGDLKIEGNTIVGKLIVQEWINGITQAEPRKNPTIYLKATDGTEIQCDVKYVEPYVYKFSVDIGTINILKDYKIEVRCASTNNISNNTIVQIEFSKNYTIGEVNNYNAHITNSLLNFTYDGYMTSSQYGQITLNGTTITGNLIVQEWIKGVKQERPKINPVITLKAEDGSIIDCKVKNIEPYVYSYQFDINRLDINNKYKVEVQAGTNKNISKHTKVEVEYTNQIIGTKGIYNLRVEKSQIKFDYDGYMTNSPYSSITLNGNIMTGRLVIQEWLNGTKQIEPTSLPKIILKGSNGTKIVGSLKYIEKYVYEYQFGLSNINKQEKYELEVQCTNQLNISEHKDVLVNYSNVEIGTIDNYKMKYINNQIIFEEINNNYDGYMTNSPYSGITLNGNMMTGQLVIQEWLNGTKQIQPTSLPKIVLKASNGTQLIGTLKYIQPYIYEYQFNLNSIDKTLKYEMEVQCTNPDNISTHKDVVVQYLNTTIGIIGNHTMKYVNWQIIFEEVNKNYDGYMTNSPYSPINLNGNTMTGQLVIQEWLNGTKQMQPTSLPKIVLKGSNGTELVGILKYLQPYVYEYQFDLRNIDKTQKYEMEVQCTNPNNISAHKDVVVKYSNTTIGEIDNYTMKYAESKIIFEEIDNNYDGYMTNSPYSEITLNGDIMTGKLVIQEWLNGTKQIEPTSLPRIVLKNEDGAELLATVKNIEPYVYQYQFDISELEIGNYLIEVQGTNSNNISTHQNVKVNYEDHQIGTYRDFNYEILNGKLIISK